MKRTLVTLAGVLAALLACVAPAAAFCGFYVAKADTQLFNKASQVVLVRDGDRTVLTTRESQQESLHTSRRMIAKPSFKKLRFEPCRMNER